MKEQEKMDPLPLGKREDQRLEFKGRDALGDLRDIAREVVAMLNATGGEIWIGIREAEGFAVAAEPLGKAGKERDRLNDHLVEVIEPAPSEKDVRLQVVPVGRGRGEVLKVSVGRPERGEGGERKPYALLGKQGSRKFLLRVGARIRPMEREEIFGAAGLSSRGFRVREGTGRPEQAAQLLKEAREEVLRGEGGVFWIGIQPEESLELDWDQVEKEKEKEILERILRDPRETGGRPGGWGFANPYGRMEIRQEKILLEQTFPNSLEIREDGGIRFQRELWSLLAGREANRLHGLALLETAVSLFRLARRLLFQEDFFRGERGPLLADAALVGVKGLPLVPRAPGTIALLDLLPRAPSDLVLLTRPVEIGAEELEDPIQCGFKLVRGLFRAFGLEGSAVPVDHLRRLERISR